MPKAIAAEKALLDVLPKTLQSDLLKGLGQLNSAIEGMKVEEAAPKKTAKRAPAKKKPAKKPAARKAAPRRKKS